ncbi:integrin alpha-PS3-like [Anopheles aquasalis]|uniref:integrin alpha-PS3-like n=1 Tax=Anopheles aquasalis TaxID=42839 RepID=UPI00215A3531|nr:integrin alpha-PS3-like [Anopheles aquasalis]
MDRFICLLGCILMLSFTYIAHGNQVFREANYIFRKTAVNSFRQQNRSSYFGYTVNLRVSGVFIGAPRAQSQLESQRNIHEPGAVYKCSYTSTSDCWPFHLDKEGNIHVERYDGYIRSERKDYRLLGAAMDGLTADGNWFVVCAPKAIGELNEQYHLHGCCYVVSDTRAPNVTEKPHKIKPFMLNKMQGYKFLDNKKAYFYMLGQLGFNVHVTDDGKEIIIGAPGVMDWTGTVIRYRRNYNSATRMAWKNVYVVPDRYYSHETIVPNPLHVGTLSTFSYFGYAVNSGRFLANQKILYVASAPSSKGGLGQVFIFDYAQLLSNDEIGIRVLKSFTGHQIGEYFGYALLTEDFNKDGLADLAIAAPMHSRTKEFDNGVVYVYLNKGGLNFELQAILQSSYGFGGRFGTSLGKIGDINRDGYGDMAVGAPHEGDGVVYIFPGSDEGINTKPTQLIKAPSTIKTNQPAMFGYAISRGVDIDGNGYNDLAIGAPNAETVYVYRAYPIVKVIATINLNQTRIPIGGASIEVEICFTREFALKDEPSFDVELEYSLQLDLTYRRASFQNNASNPLSNTINLRQHKSCQKYNISVIDSYTIARKEENETPNPVTIELTFNISSKSSPPQGSDFCEQCAVLDTNNINRISRDIPIDIYCGGHICQSNLRILSLQWINITNPFVVGSRETATLELMIDNVGDTAHYLQLEMIVRKKLTLAKLKRDCVSKTPSDGKSRIVCVLKNRLPLETNTAVNASFTFDLSWLEGHDNLKVHVNVTASSPELEPSDNENETDLMVIERSDIELFGKPSAADISLDHAGGLFNVTHNWTLYNNGPSPLRHAILQLEIPLVYNRTTSTGRCRQRQIIQRDTISLQGTYRDQFFTFQEMESTAESKTPTTVTHEIAQDDHESRSRRSNPSISQNESRIHLDLGGKRSLSPNRTILFNCSKGSHEECYKTLANLGTFLPGNLPIIIQLQYTIDLDAINTCFEGEKDTFVIQLHSHLHKTSDSDRLSFNISSNNTDTMITKSIISPPISFYIYSSLGGLVVLALISYTMYRKGFFERTLRNELKHRYKQIETNASVDRTTNTLNSSVLVF